MSDGSTIEWLAWPGYRPASWNPMLCTERGIRPVIDGINIQTPMRWRKPRCALVDCDLFSLPDEAIDRVFAVMALCPQHRFIVLTKRAERMHGYHSMARAHPVGLEALGLVMESVSRNPQTSVGSGLILQGDICHLKVWPLPNVVLGVSVEDQATADERIPHLLATPAACRMVSAEPLLGPVDFTAITGFIGTPRADRDNIRERTDALRGSDRREYLRQDGTWNHRRLDDPDGNPVFSTNCGPRLGWIVTGGESGPGARPMHPDWARSIRSQCQTAGVAYFHKQNGKYEVVYDRDRDDPDWRRCDSTRAATPRGRWLNLAGGHGFHGERVLRVVPVGKHSAGRLLDGRTHDEFPDISPKIPA